MRRPLPPTASLVAALLLATLTLAGCGGSSGSGGTTTIRVYAAASLTESFTALGKQFERGHPGTKVQFNFGPSSGLADSISQGSPADVFASAAPSNMDSVVNSGDAKDPQDFAKNTAEIAVPPDNPGQITQLSDLAKPGVKVAVCQSQVPCGALAAQVFAAARLTVKPATEEADVKSVLTKVDLGDVDAGVVYVTDVKAAGAKVHGVPIPAAQNATTSYPIAALTGSTHHQLAQAFVDLVRGRQGQQVLTKAGFESP